jgi:uncharacterized small protein (DUF1192 family)
LTKPTSQVDQEIGGNKMTTAEMLAEALRAASADTEPLRKRIADLEAKISRMKAEARLCLQDAARDQDRALERIVEIADNE